jgi:hypothetical protein
MIHKATMERGMHTRKVGKPEVEDLAIVTVLSRVDKLPCPNQAA